MDIAAPTEVSEQQVEDQYGITWTLKLLPLLQPDLERTLEAQDIEDLMYVFEHHTSPKVMRWARVTAKAHVKAIVSAINKDGPASFEGKAASDPTLLAAILDRHVGLARSATLKALDMGGVVLEQRGNSQPASA